MAMAIDSALPVGRSLRLRLDRDELIKRSLMVVIALYLVVALAAPLAIMLSKPFSTYSFNLANFEFQVSDKDGNWGEPITAAALNEKLNAVPPAKLATNSDGRLQATSFFPDFSFRSPVKYKIRGTTSDATYLVGLKPQSGTEWQELTSNDSAE